MLGKGATSKYCVVITLDVQNVFNSANEILIRRSLGMIAVPSYLVVLVNNYLTGKGH